MMCPLCEATAVEFWSSPLVFHRCADCGLIFKDPANAVDAAEAERRYRQHSEDPSDVGHRGYLSSAVDPLIARLEDARGGEGLDYGCGAGRTLQAILLEKGLRCAVYDPLFFPDPSVLGRTYDFVTCTEVAEHFANPAAEFAKLFDLVKDDGILVVMSQTPPADFGPWYYHRDPTHVSFYSARTWAWLARRYVRNVELHPRGVAVFSKI